MAFVALILVLLAAVACTLALREKFSVVNALAVPLFLALAAYHVFVIGPRAFILVAVAGVLLAILLKYSREPEPVDIISALPEMQKIQLAPSVRLYRYLEHRNSLLRGTAAMELVRRKAPDALERLTAMLETDSDGAVDVVHALGELGDHRAGATLVRALASADPDVVTEIVDVLELLSPSEAIPGLIDCLGTARHDVVGEVFAAIAKFGGIPVLADRWDEVPRQAKEAYLEMAWEGGDRETFEKIIHLFLSDENQEIQRQASRLWRPFLISADETDPGPFYYSRDVVVREEAFPVRIELDEMLSLPAERGRVTLASNVIEAEFNLGRGFHLLLRTADDSGVVWEVEIVTDAQSLTEIALGCDPVYYRNAPPEWKKAFDERLLLKIKDSALHGGAETRVRIGEDRVALVLEGQNVQLVLASAETALLIGVAGLIDDPDKDDIPAFVAAVTIANLLRRQDEKLATRTAETGAPQPGVAYRPSQP